MNDLAELAREALAAKLVNVGPQIRFLRELARRVAEAAHLHRLQELSLEPAKVSLKLLTNGRLSPAPALESILSQKPPLLTLEVLSRRLQAIVHVVKTPEADEIRDAVRIIDGGA